MLELKNICKNYNPGSVNELCLFQDFNLTIEDGRDGYSMIMSELEFRKKYEKDRLR